jgi:hypothetical protein
MCGRSINATGVRVDASLARVTEAGCRRSCDAERPIELVTMPASRTPAAPVRVDALGCLVALVTVSGHQMRLEVC